MLVDLRHAFRSLRLRPSLTLGSVLSTGLATGVAFAVLLLVDAILLRPLPLRDPDRVVTLFRETGGERRDGFVYPEFERAAEGSTAVFEALAGAGQLVAPVAGWSGAEPVEPATITFVTEHFFDAVGVQPASGRRFAPSEHRTGADPVALVTHTFWQSRLAADADVIGRRIRVGGQETVVVGVLPRGFRGLRLDNPTDLLMPLRTAPLVGPPMNYFGDGVAIVGGSRYGPSSWISIVGRLRPDATAARAEALLSTLLRRDPGEDPADGFRDAGAGAAPPETVVTASTSWAALSTRTRTQALPFVSMLAVVALLVVLAGCANVAGLTLVRNEQRRRETAIRLALGCGRGGLLRLHLLETLLLTILGALVGLLTAVWVVQGAGRFFVLPGGMEIADLDLGWTAPMMGWGAGAALLTAVVCGVGPALHAVPAAGAAPRRRWRGAVLAGQVAVVVVLMIGAALFARSMRALIATDVGLDGDGLFYAEVTLSDARYGEPLAARSFHDAVVDRLRRVPGVEAVTFGNLPLVNRPLRIPSVRVDGGEPVRLPTQVDVFFCGPDYVRTVGLRLQAGRDFEPLDIGEAGAAAIVNEALARKLWGGDEPVGRWITFLPLTRWMQVVGVVRDGKYGGLRESGELAVFLPWDGRIAGRRGAIIGRGSGRLAPAAQQAIRDVDPQVWMPSAGAFADRVATLTRPQRIGALLLGGLGAFALVLAVLGVYGAVAQEIAGRRREIGIRMALGARPAAVVGATLAPTLAWVGLGCAVGIGAAAAFGRLAEPYLFEVGPQDALAYGAATAAVVTAAFVGGLTPALRATRPAAAARLIREATWAE